MDLRKIKTLIELLEQSGIAELEVKEGEESVRIARHSTAPQQMMTYAPPLPGPGAYAAAPSAAPAESPAARGNGAAAPAASAQLEVKSPMVGTFYGAPEPGAKPYVAVGDRVQKGQTLCIIEAMKIMNEIESEFTGVVKEILAQDAQPVEYGQVLFRIDPNG